MRLYIYIYVLVLTSLAACNSAGCLENRSALPAGAFYSSTTGEAITVTGLRIYGITSPNDSALVTPSQQVSETPLPFRPLDNLAEFRIQYYAENEATPYAHDNISIHYTPIPYFISNDCGATLFYHIDRIDHTTAIIDSITIATPDSTITNIQHADLRIYLRTRQENPTPSADE